MCNMSLIGISLMIIIVIVMFSLIFDTSFIGSLVSIGVDNTSIVNGSSTTYIVTSEGVLFNIDTSDLITAGITILVAIILVATITGVQFLGSGLSSESVRIFILLTGYIGIWTVLSILAFNLIVSIAIFGSIIYIMLTIGYTIGVVQKIS